MRSHEPRGYSCPFCLLLAGCSTSISSPQNIVYRDTDTAVIVSPHWWATNPGNVVVVPIDHVENLYTVSEHLAGRVFATAQKAARALVEVENCEGTSLRQHNEPAGGQDVWHLHVHVVPRWSGDAFTRGEHRMRSVDLADQHAFADRLRGASHWRGDGAALGPSAGDPGDSPES